jgi:hypothetical protein
VRAARLPCRRLFGSVASYSVSCPPKLRRTRGHDHTRLCALSSLLPPNISCKIRAAFFLVYTLYINIWPRLRLTMCATVHYKCMADLQPQPRRAFSTMLPPAVVSHSRRHSRSTPMTPRSRFVDNRVRPANVYVRSHRSCVTQPSAFKAADENKERQFLEAAERGDKPSMQTLLLVCPPGAHVRHMCCGCRSNQQ